MGRRDLQAAGVGPRGADALDAGKLDGRNAALGGSSVELPAALPSRHSVHRSLEDSDPPRSPSGVLRSPAPRHTSSLPGRLDASGERCRGGRRLSDARGDTEPALDAPHCRFRVRGKRRRGNAGSGRKRGMGGHASRSLVARARGAPGYEGSDLRRVGRGRGETPGKPISVALRPGPSDRRCARTGCSARTSHERRAAAPGARRSPAPPRARLVRRRPGEVARKDRALAIALHGLVHGEGVRHRPRRAARRGRRAPRDLGREDAAEVGRDSRGAERRKRAAHRGTGLVRRHSHRRRRGSHRRWELGARGSRARLFPLRLGPFLPRLAVTVSRGARSRQPGPRRLTDSTHRKRSLGAQRPRGRTRVSSSEGSSSSWLRGSSSGR